MLYYFVDINSQKLIASNAEIEVCETQIQQLIRKQLREKLLTMRRLIYTRKQKKLENCVTVIKNLQLDGFDIAVLHVISESTNMLR